LIGIGAAVDLIVAGRAFKHTVNAILG
jgi:hypothetical protein